MTGIARTWMPAALRLIVHLEEVIPDNVGFTSWEIMPGHIGAQLSDDYHPFAARRILDELAQLLGLEYRTEQRPTFDIVSAIGLYQGGVQVQLWTMIDRPETTTDEKGQPT